MRRPYACWADAMAILAVLRSDGGDPYARWPMRKTVHGAVSIPAHNDQASFAEGGTQFLLRVHELLPAKSIPLWWQDLGLWFYWKATDGRCLMFCVRQWYFYVSNDAVCG